jgi:hypothetical protein
MIDDNEVVIRRQGLNQDELALAIELGMIEDGLRPYTAELILRYAAAAEGLFFKGLAEIRNGELRLTRIARLTLPRAVRK